MYILSYLSHVPIHTTLHLSFTGLLGTGSLNEKAKHVYACYDFGDTGETEGLSGDEITIGFISAVRGAALLAGLEGESKFDDDAMEVCVSICVATFVFIWISVSHASTPLIHSETGVHEEVFRGVRTQRRS